MNAPLNKKIYTFISRQSPYGNSNARSCLDMVLACAVFDQTVNYVFLGDGVCQLLAKQCGDKIEFKTFSSALEALALYGVNNIYVEQESLDKLSIKLTDLAIPAKQINKLALAELIDESDLVFTL